MYRNFLKHQSMYWSTVFMNGGSCDHLAAQINIRFRIRKVFQLNNFGIVQSAHVAEHYKHAVIAMKKEKKFIN